MAGWVSTAAGSSLRAFEDTNTSRRMEHRVEPAGTWARQSPLSSRAAAFILPRRTQAFGIGTGTSDVAAASEPGASDSGSDGRRQAPARSSRCRGSGLLLLLVLAHLLQRVRVDHVGNRAVALQRVVASNLLPPDRAHAHL